TLAPIHLDPTSEWISKAKSNAVAPLGNTLRSPLGVKTKTSSWNKFPRKSSINSMAVPSLDSRSDRTWVIHSSSPIPALVAADDIFMCYTFKARTSFAIAADLRVQIGTSTPCPEWLISVVWRDSYPFALGVLIQSLRRSGLGR